MTGLAAASELPPPSSLGALQVDWLGRVGYAEAVAIQEEAVASRRHGLHGDRLLLLEHPAVVTLGRSARAENLRVDPSELSRRGVGLHEARRGGDVTYHAPGQLVGYLVVDLDAQSHGGLHRDVHRFLRAIEEALIRALSQLGVPCRAIDGLTGVFVDAAGPPRKLASIGIGLRNWVTWHGFALNVSMDLSGFAAIVPCGLRDVEMTSVARELDHRGSTDALDVRARDAVAGVFSGR